MRSSRRQHDADAQRGVTWVMRMSDEYSSAASTAVFNFSQKRLGTGENGRLRKSYARFNEENNGLDHVSAACGAAR